MVNKIPTWQRILQRILATRPITALIAPVLQHADALLLRLTGGRLDFTRASGLPVIELITVGARSGKTHTLPLAGYPDGDRIVLVASNFGRAWHPAWYHNLIANPQCVVRKDGQERRYLARETDGEERERYWRLAVLYYSGYEAYQQWAANRKIPVMVLEPKINSNRVVE